MPPIVDVKWRTLEQKVILWMLLSENFPVKKKWLRKNGGGLFSSQEERKIVNFYGSEVCLMELPFAARRACKKWKHLDAIKEMLVADLFSL